MNHFHPSNLKHVSTRYKVADPFVTGEPLWTHAFMVVLGITAIVLATLLRPNDDTAVAENFDEKTAAVESDTHQCAILVHTFDGYRRYWKSWLHFFNRHHPDPEWNIYFANEERDVTSLFPEGRVRSKYHQIHCGKGAWGQRLIKALEQIPTKYVLYMQEDMWLTSRLSPQYLEACLFVAEQKQSKQLKLQAGCHHRHWKTDGEGWPPWYVVSHQPGIWNRKYLLETLRAVGVSVQGVISGWGRQMMAQAGIRYKVEADEVGYKLRQETK
jgi:hypothetical protein